MVEGEDLMPTQSFTLPALAADWLAWTTLQKLPVTRFVSKPYERDKGKHDEKYDTPSQHRGSDNNKNDLEVNINVDTIIHK